MTEKPILFSTEMVKAILADRKTQTRRVVKFQKRRPEWDSPHTWNGSVAHVDGGGNWIWWSGGNDSKLAERTKQLYPNGEGVPCPYGKPGDLLWVRETWGVHSQFDHFAPSKVPPNPLNGTVVFYRASDPLFDGKWRPSIHMPRWASRITLRVTDVRVERVQDITLEAAISEGVGTAAPRNSRQYALGIGTERVEFANLWDAINAKRGYSWQSNPWVWAVEFERVTP